MSLILAIDQSTSATKALLFNSQGQRLDRESIEHMQHYPQPGWVEHDAEEIWQNVLLVTKKLIERNSDKIESMVGVSITNQRETIVIFNRDTGQPMHPAIVWQCRRSDKICMNAIENGFSNLVHDRTGLRIDSYFSGPKLKWILLQNPELKAKLESGEALIGTIDTYLIYRLTNGSVFATDYTNASRTLLFDIKKLCWDVELCTLWGVPMKALAEVRSSDANFGPTILGGVLKYAIPIIGVMGDSQASLYAQKCYEPGSAKVTFGTGSSVLLNIGYVPKLSDKGVLTALAWVTKGNPVYAFEGIIIHSGATLNWLRDRLGLLSDIADAEKIISSVSDNGDVYLVPAFAGLGLPHWLPEARAAIVGLSGHSDKRHIIRAALESISFQLKDVLDVMQAESGVPLKSLKVDGGPTSNNFLMQFTSDMTQSDLILSDHPDCSALGAALMGLAGLGIYSSFISFEKEEKIYKPKMSPASATQNHAGWLSAVQQVLCGSKQ